jgi:hypothetical protein
MKILGIVLVVLGLVMTVALGLLSSALASSGPYGNSAHEVKLAIKLMFYLLPALFIAGSFFLIASKRRGALITLGILQLLIGVPALAIVMYLKDKGFEMAFSNDGYIWIGLLSASKNLWWSAGAGGIAAIIAATVGNKKPNATNKV